MRRAWNPNVTVCICGRLKKFDCPFLETTFCSISYINFKINQSFWSCFRFLIFFFFNFCSTFFEKDEFRIIFQIRKCLKFNFKKIKQKWQKSSGIENGQRDFPLDLDSINSIFMVEKCYTYHILKIRIRFLKLF